MRYLVFLAMMISSSTLLASTKSELNEKKELRCLALNIYHEARGEPTQGQLAVALVTMNRVYSKKYPGTVCRVVWQRRQFSWTHDGRSDRPRDKAAWKKSMKMAKFVYNKYGSLRHQARNALDITKGALHYYAPRFANPYWAEMKDVTVRVGEHVFLKERSS